MAALDLDMAACWQPSPRFMARVSKRVMAAALTAAGQDALAADLPLLKKPIAAGKRAAALVSTGWRPPVLCGQEAVAGKDNGPMPWEDNDAETYEEAA